MKIVKEQYKWLAAGIVFSILWPSAATATKIALQQAQPLTIAIVRFFIAAGIMLLIAHIAYKKPLPARRQWKQLAIYGLLNITIYLGMYIIAMKEVTASIGALTVAINPVLISFLSILILKKPATPNIIIAILICLAGVFIVAAPLLKGADVTLRGLILITTSMVAYSVGTIYFSARRWGTMHLFVINGWQTFFGGIFLLPFTIFTYKTSANYYGLQFWFGTLWLAIPVSIFAVLLWLGLLKKDAVKAGMWLFLCPVCGIIIAAIIMKDTISIYTIMGLALVLCGLAISQSGRQKRALKSTNGLKEN